MSSQITSNKSKVDFLSDYNLRGIIGKGTFSVVKLGEHKKTKEKVAIKILQKNKILNKEDLVRIEREIEILKRLKHPNVIKIHRIEEDDKKFYIIMEFCENGELFNRIVERRNLTEDEAALFYYQLINGLEYIHKNNIVHRDLKPENLLLSKDDLLKIIDFGLSNYTGYNILLGTPCGSPCYASPEMVSGQRYNGYMIDVWSTGIILFAMVNGYLPFEDNNNEILFGKILKCKIHYPKSMGELTLDLMKKIITPDPKKRITLEQIKHHPFYLKGKELFNNKFPELINEINGINNANININNNRNNVNDNEKKEIKEIVIKNMSPIVNNNILNNIKENKHKNNINININTNNSNNKYYSLNIKDLNNIYPKYTATEINSTIPNNMEDLNNPKLNQIKTQVNSNKKDIMIHRDYKLDSPSSLRSDEIPKDSEPIRISEEKNSNKKIQEKKIEIKRNMKEELKIITLTGQNNLRKYKIYKINPKSQNKKIPANEKIKEINEQIKNVAKNLGENIYMNKSRTKEKDRKKINEITYVTPATKKINDPMIENLYQKEKMSSTLDNTTTIATKMEFYNSNTNTNDNQKNKFSMVTHKIDKNSYIMNKANQTYDDRNKNEINNSKFVNISKTLSKRIQRKPIYVNINKENENINNNFENNMNLTNVTNLNYDKLSSKMKSYTFDERNNNLKQNTNNNNIKGIFNEFQIIQGNKNPTLNNDNLKINTNNIINSYNNTINVNDRNIRIPLMIGKTSTTIKQIPRKDLNNNKEIYKNNNYMNTRNNINSNTERKTLIVKSKNLSVSHHPKYIRIINPTNNNNKIYISNNSTNFQGVSPINDKYFDTITINNNNNINFHEPKLFIYVQNNNNTNDYQRLKTESNPNKTKMFFKFDNNNNNTLKNTNKINSVDYNSTPGKRTNSNIIENKTIDNDYDKKIINKITPIKSNQAINNKEIKSNEKFIITKKIYNSIDPNKRIYTFRTNDMVFNNSKKSKDNNMKYISSKNNNNIYFERNYNTIDNKSSYINNNTSERPHNNYNRLGKNDYIYQNLHNVVKTDGNMDLWSYDNERIINDNNILKNNYINNNQRYKKVENINNFDNINYREKLQKLQMKNYIINNKENDNKNMKYIIPTDTNTVDSLNYRKIHPIRSDKMRTPMTKQNTNNKNIIEFKQYVKHY